MPRAFVIRPFNTKRDRDGVERDFDRVYAQLIVPALQAVGMGGGDARDAGDVNVVILDASQLLQS